MFARKKFTIKICSKIEILVEHRKFNEKFEILFKNRILNLEIHDLKKIPKFNFWLEIHFLPKNSTFV